MSFERAFANVTPSGIGCTSQDWYVCIYSQEMYMYISINIIRNVYVHQYIHPKRCMCTPLVATHTSLVACMHISRHVCTSCEMTPTRQMYVYTSCSMYVHLKTCMYITQDVRVHHTTCMSTSLVASAYILCTYSLLHLECRFCNLKTQSII